MLEAVSEKSAVMKIWRKIITEGQRMGAKGENLIMFVPPKLLTRLTEKQTHFIH